MFQLIIICGTPGTGKTEVANLLKRHGFKVIHLSNLVIREKLYLKYDEERDSYIIDEKKLIDKLIEIEKETSEPLIVEGIGAEIIPNKFVDICFVLICEPKELEKRLKSKGYPYTKIQENLEAERLSLIWGEALDNYGRSKVVVIDTTDLTIDEVVEHIMKEIKKRGLL